MEHKKHVDAKKNKEDITMKKLFLIIGVVLSINPIAHSDVYPSLTKSSHISSDGKNIMTSVFYTKDKEFPAQCKWDRVNDFSRDYVFTSISKDGKTVLVGKKGGLDIYTTTIDKWWEKPTANISIEGEVTSNYYTSISADGETALIVCNNNVYVYTKKDDNNWNNDSKINIENPNDVAISGDGTTILVGSYPNVYIYTRKDKVWTKNLLCRYFSSIAMSNDGKTIIVGKYGDMTGSIGEIDIYTKKDDGSWSSVPEILSSVGVILGSNGSVSVSGDGKTIIIGGVERSQTYCICIYVKNDNGWDPVPVFKDFFSKDVNYGMDVSISDDGETALAHTKEGTIVYTSSDPYQEWGQGELE